MNEIKIRIKKLNNNQTIILSIIGRHDDKLINAISLPNAPFVFIEGEIFSNEMLQELINFTKDKNDINLYEVKETKPEQCKDSRKYTREEVLREKQWFHKQDSEHFESSRTRHNRNKYGD